MSYLDRIPFDQIDEDMLRRGAEACADWMGAPGEVNGEDYLLARKVLEAALSTGENWSSFNHGGSE